MPVNSKATGQSECNAEVPKVIMKPLDTTSERALLKKDQIDFAKARIIFQRRMRVKTKPSILLSIDSFDSLCKALLKQTGKLNNEYQLHMQTKCIMGHLHATSGAKTTTHNGHTAPYCSRVCTDASRRGLYRLPSAFGT